MHSQRLEGDVDPLEIPYRFWESAAFSSEQGNNGHCRLFPMHFSSQTRVFSRWHLSNSLILNSLLFGRAGILMERSIPDAISKSWEGLKSVPFKDP